MQPEYRKVSFDNSWSDKHVAVRCPGCGSHLAMEYGDSVHEVGSDLDTHTSPSGTRGGWLETRGECSECGDGYSLVIANHKGSLTLAIASLPADLPEPPLAA